MALDFFTHNEIAAVISDQVPFQPFLLELAFGSEFVTNDEQINFDKIDPDKRMSVFVNPRVPGKVVKDSGFAVRTYKPGYIKDKQTVDPNHVFKRRPGEPMAAPLSPSERYAATVADIAINMLTRRDRRLEWMAAQLLLNGSYTMTGDAISVEVDMGRAAGNTVTLAGADRWGQTGISPVKTLQNMVNKSLTPIRNIVIGHYAFADLIADPLWEKLVFIQLMSGNGASLQMGPMQGLREGVVFRGTIPSLGVNVWTYTHTYLDPDNNNTETLYVPEDAVLFIPEAQYGWQAFAAIWDEAANYQGMPYFFKNWAENDPGTPFIMLQSAPMLAHTRINGTIALRTGSTQPQGGK
jgi:hypothetical protein